MRIERRISEHQRGGESGTQLIKEYRFTPLSASNASKEADNLKNLEEEGN